MRRQITFNQSNPPVQYGRLDVLPDFSQIALDSASDVPIYRQLADRIRALVHSGIIQSGTNLPATRELAGLLKLNRTTVSAAYDVLEQARILEGHVGRGSFIAQTARTESPRSIGRALLPPLEDDARGNSRPIAHQLRHFAASADAFPVRSIPPLTREVIDSSGSRSDSPTRFSHRRTNLRRFLM